MHFVFIDANHANIGVEKNFAQVLPNDLDLTPHYDGHLVGFSSFQRHNLTLILNLAFFAELMELLDFLVAPIGHVRYLLEEIDHHRYL